MGKKIARRLTQSDIDYSLLKVSVKESEMFPDSEFALVLDDGGNCVQPMTNRITVSPVVEQFNDTILIKGFDQETL